MDSSEVAPSEAPERRDCSFRRRAHRCARWTAFARGRRLNNSSVTVGLFVPEPEEDSTVLALLALLQAAANSARLLGRPALDYALSFPILLQADVGEGRLRAFIDEGVVEHSVEVTPPKPGPRSF